MQTNNDTHDPVPENKCMVPRILCSRTKAQRISRMLPGAGPNTRVSLQNICSSANTDRSKQRNRQTVKKRVSQYLPLARAPP